jgi:hypothetical protein
MALTPAQEAGFALAALLAGDRALTQVEAGLDAETLAPLRRALSSDEPKAQVLAGLLELVRPPLHTVDGLSPRMVALLAPRLPRALARESAPRATAARPSFSPTKELGAVVLRSARALARKDPR